MFFRFKFFQYIFISELILSNRDSAADESIITIIKEDPEQPNTYKIVCKEDEPAEPIESYEIITSDTIDVPIHLNDDQLKEHIAQLLKTVVDDDVLEKFGYPKTPIEDVLSAVIKQCDQVPVDNTTCQDPSTKLRENVKLLFTSVIDDDSIKEMLNNHTIDEVICHIVKLSEDDDWGGHRWTIQTLQLMNNRSFELNWKYTHPCWFWIYLFIFWNCIYTFKWIIKI